MVSGSEAAVLEQIIACLPSVAAAIAKPLSKTGKMVFVGGEGDDSE